MRKLYITAISIALFSIASYGQTQCQDSPNNPSIGTEYEYRVDVTPAGLTGGVYKWYVTQDGANLLNGTILNDGDKFNVSTTGSSSYNSDTGTTHTLKLKWNSDALGTQPYFLVLKYKGNNGTCEVHNVKALRITPLNNFKLRVDPVSNENGDAFTGAAKVCAGDVSEATIVGNDVKYIYGQTTLYYKVTMTGYQGSWKPTITLPALQGKDNTNGKRKYNAIQWKEQGSANFTDFADFTQDGDTKTLLAKQATDKTEFILKVVIDNGTHEGLTEESIALATKGEMLLKNGNIGPRDVADDCQQLTEDRKANQSISERPTITAGSGVFITQLQ